MLIKLMILNALLLGRMSWAQFVPMGMMSKITAPAVTYVQRAENSNDSTAAATLSTTNFSTAPTTGNTIICAVYQPTANTITNITDTKSNTYALAYYKNTGVCDPNSGVSIYYASNITGGASFKTTVTFNAAVSTTGISCHEFSKLAINPLDSANMSGVGSYSSSVNGGPAISTYSKDLVFAFVVTFSTPTAGSGFTSISTLEGNVIEYKVVHPSGSTPITATLASSNCNDVWWATFKSL